MVKRFFFLELSISYRSPDFYRVFLDFLVFIAPKFKSSWILHFTTLYLLKPAVNGVLLPKQVLGHGLIRGRYLVLPRLPWINSLARAFFNKIHGNGGLLNWINFLPTSHVRKNVLIVRIFLEKGFQKSSLLGNIDSLHCILYLLVLMVPCI